MIRFNNDYSEGCHPAVLAKLTETNLEQTCGYGLDEYCEQAAEMIRKTFACPDARVHFLVGGTQANATVIESILMPYEGALCAHTGHINCHETGAIEATGHKVMAMPGGAEGKITAAQVEEAVLLQGDNEHEVRPGMVYISMTTEVGTVYTRRELQELHDVCRKYGLPLYIDGARLASALMSDACDIPVEEYASLCDVFTVGGTKCGALFGEAIVFTDPALGKRFRYFIKRHGGMLAKGRLLGLQFIALMENNLYFSLGRRQNAQAMRIRAALEQRGITVSVDSPTNQQFPVLTPAQREKLAADFVLEDIGPAEGDDRVMRICTSWATRDEDVERLITAINTL